MEMMLDKKQIRTIFLFAFKMGHEAARQLATSTTCLSQELLMNLQCSGGSGSFAKEMRALKMRSAMASHRKLTTTNWKHIEADPVTTAWEVAKELNHSMVNGIWSKLERWKTSVSGCLLSWPKLKISLFWNVVLSYSMQQQWTVSSSVRCDEKWVLYDNQWWSAQWLDQEEAAKHFSKLSLHQKKVMVTVWWSADYLIQYSFLNSGETITSEKYTQQINEMHQKLQSLQLALVNTMGPILFQDNARPHIGKPTLQKLNELGYTVLPHPPHSPDLSPTNYHFFKHLNNFYRESASTNSRRQKFFSKSLSNSEAWIFTL